MSCFINSSIHFANVRKSLESFQTRQLYNNDINNLFPGIKDPEKVESITEIIIKIMIGLQIESVYIYSSEQLTKEKKNLLQEGTAAAAMRNGKKLTNIELYKALQCIRYQIEDNEIIRYRDLTEQEKKVLSFIDQFLNILAVQIISELPEYNTAAWAY